MVALVEKPEFNKTPYYMKRKIPFILATLIFMVVFIFAAHLTIWAQVPADSALAAGTGIADLIPAGWWKYILSAYGIFEVIVRQFPTVKNYSPAGWAIKVFQAILPNKNANTPSQPHP